MLFIKTNVVPGIGVGTKLSQAVFVEELHVLMVLLLSRGQEADGMEIFSDEEVPTEDMIERMEERLETATSQQKNLFLIIFQVCGRSPPHPPLPPHKNR